MQTTPKQFLKLLVTGLIALGVLGTLLFFRGGENKKSLNEIQMPENGSIDAIVINNQGGNMEGHTPRGFQGMGTGLFAGDNLNPGFPNNDGVQFFLTFDLGSIPSGASVTTKTGFKIASAILRSKNLHTQGTPFKDLGELKAEAVRYDTFSSALWNQPSDGSVCAFTASSDGSVACTVTDIVQRTLDNKLRSAQFRVRFEKAGDGDGNPDLALFYNTDSNKNEPGIFQLEVVVENASSEKSSVQQDVEKNREVSFLASDGYKLSGTFWIPDSKERRPAIILSHQFNSTRHDYDSFIPVLLKNEYAVLAYDTRGFGESKNGAADINDFPKDVIGAITFLKKQTEVNSSRIGIIGASVGANVAFVVSGSVKEIRAAVALSPSNTGARGVLLGNGIPNFSPGRIFIASDEREKSDADFIFAKAVEPKKQRLYPGFGHGIGLLKSSEAQNDILSFFEHIFATAGPTSLYNDIRIPVVIHIIKNSGKVSTARNKNDILALFQKSQDIWNQAHIVFDTRLEEIMFDDEMQKAVERQDFQKLYAILPRNDRALHIVFTENLGGPNGIAVAPSLALIADSTTVNDFRATAHEIGHLMGLPHTDENRERLLFRGANGTKLTIEEINLARREAKIFISAGT